MFDIIYVDANPNRKDADADHDGLPTERPAHFRDERADFKNQPEAGERLAK